MATKVAFQLESSLASKHLTDAEYIKGGYLVVDTIATRNSLPIYTASSDGIIVEGSLCYVQATSKFYIYKDSAWEEWKTGGITYVPTNGYTGQQFYKDNIIEWLGKVYICLADVSGADGNRPDVDGGSTYWKPMNSGNVTGTTPNGNKVEGDIWFDTNN